MVLVIWGGGGGGGVIGVFFLAGDGVEQGSIERTETNVGVMGPWCVVSVYFFLLVPRLVVTIDCPGGSKVSRVDI